MLIAKFRLCKSSANCISIYVRFGEVFQKKNIEKLSIFLRSFFFLKFGKKNLFCFRKRRKKKYLLAWGELVSYHLRGPTLDSVLEASSDLVTLLIPKSEILGSKSSVSKTLRAAKSLWIIYSKCLFFVFVLFCFCFIFVKRFCVEKKRKLTKCSIPNFFFFYKIRNSFFKNKKKKQQNISFQCFFIYLFILFILFYFKFIYFYLWQYHEWFWIVGFDWCQLDFLNIQTKILLA